MEFLFLLLPVAAASGWWIARRTATQHLDHSPDRAPTFFRGLNYLLNEQPVGPDTELCIEVEGQLAHGHAVAQRNGRVADERQ